LIDLLIAYVAIDVLPASRGINFMPDIQIVAQVQLDNIRRSRALSHRDRWEYQPGDELFVSFGQSAFIPATSCETRTSQLTIRPAHTIRC
jgi:hypothetical protein